MKKISKEKATELIKRSSGKFITVKNIKLNGDEREYKSSKFNMNRYGYLNIWEQGQYRNVNPNTVFYLKSQGIEYAVN